MYNFCTHLVRILQNCALLWYSVSIISSHGTGVCSFISICDSLMFAQTKFMPIYCYTWILFRVLAIPHPQHAIISYHSTSMVLTMFSGIHEHEPLHCVCVTGFFSTCIHSLVSIFCFLFCSLFLQCHTQY